MIHLNNYIVEKLRINKNVKDVLAKRISFTAMYKALKEFGELNLRKVFPEIAPNKYPMDKLYKRYMLALYIVGKDIYYSYYGVNNEEFEASLSYDDLSDEQTIEIYNYILAN